MGERYEIQSGERLFFRTQNHPIKLKKYLDCSIMKLGEGSMLRPKRWENNENLSSELQKGSFLFNHQGTLSLQSLTLSRLALTDF